MAGRVLPSPQWSDALREQLRVARASAIHMACAYHAAGFAVVIDDFLDPHDAAAYQALRHHPQLRRIVLYPTQHAAHQRNHTRTGDPATRAYIDEGISMVYHHLHTVVAALAQDGWRVVDTTTLSVAATVAAIVQP